MFVHEFIVSQSFIMRSCSSVVLLCMGGMHLSCFIVMRAYVPQLFYHYEVMLLSVNVMRASVPQLFYHYEVMFLSFDV